MYVKYMEMVTGVSDGKARRRRATTTSGCRPATTPISLTRTVFISARAAAATERSVAFKSRPRRATIAIVIGLDPSTNVDPEGRRQCFDSQTYPANPEIAYVEQTVTQGRGHVLQQMQEPPLHRRVPLAARGSPYLMGCVDGEPWRPLQERRRVMPPRLLEPGLERAMMDIQFNAQGPRCRWLATTTPTW